MALVTQQEGTAWGGNQLSASWYTPALPFGEVKLLLNGWSVSEFGKLVQLDSGLLGDSVSSRTDICLQASQCCAWLSRHLRHY